MVQHLFGPNGFEGIGHLRISSGVSGGATGYIPRTIQWGHAGSGTTQYLTVDVREFGFGNTGGAFFAGGHGWQADRFYSMIEYNNGGGSGSITSVRVNDCITATGMSLSIYAYASYVITLQLSNTHSNGHGWQVYVWGPR